MDSLEWFLVCNGAMILSFVTWAALEGAGLLRRWIISVPVALLISVILWLISPLAALVYLCFIVFFTFA